MFSSLRFWEWIKGRGFDFFTGVPDSTFANLLHIVERDPSAIYIPAVREDVAIGLAVGAHLAGGRPMVLMQNSGLGVAINALTSLPLIYKTPMLVLIGWRGHGGQDAPEHIIMGHCMVDLLQDIGMPYVILQPNTILGDIERAANAMEAGRIPTAVLLRDEILE